MKSFIFVLQLVALSSFAMSENDQAAGTKQTAICSKVEQCAEYIKEQVHRKWAMPPSARKAPLVTLLEIEIAKSGEIQSVAISKSSGSIPFDESALRAVRAIDCFCEMQELKDEEYEKYFRKIQVRLSSED